MVRSADIVADGFRRVRAEEDRARIADTRAEAFRIGRNDLQMLGGNGIGKRHRIVERLHQNDRAEFVPRCPRDLRAWQRRQLCLDRAFDLVRQSLVVGNEDRLRVGVVLGLRQKIGGDPVRIGALVRDHQNFRRTGDHVDADLAEHQTLRCGDISVAGADDLRHRGDGRGAMSQRRHGLRAADAIDFTHTAELRGGQHQGIELAVRRRHHHHHTLHARDLGGHGVHQHR